jgi:glycosyltransferase involved in cell wall biosynthesis
MRILFISTVLTHYRTPFHDRLRHLLEEELISYDLIYGQADDNDTAKRDNKDIVWASKLKNLYFSFWSMKIVWQPIGRYLGKYDLIIIGQENGIVSNYIIQFFFRFKTQKIAFFGHGRNFQSPNRNSSAEKWKAFWATKVDWWFAYTDETRKHVESLGFPPERITVFNNSIDTLQLQEQFSSITIAEKTALRLELGISSENVAVYVGGIYHEKRVRFMIESAKLVRAKVSDFHFLIIGGGVEQNLFEAAAKEFDWIHYVGPKFEREKAAYMSLSKIFYMPGLVGLGVLDAFVFGTPIVTTAYPLHSPEFAYIENGSNGVVVDNWESPEAYADAVAEVLTDKNLHEKLVRGAKLSLSNFSIENMARRFAEGVIQALAVGRY